MGLIWGKQAKSPAETQEVFGPKQAKSEILKGKIQFRNRSCSISFGMARTDATARVDMASR